MSTLTLCDAAARPQDNICTRGVATTAGSRILASYVPPYDAAAAARLSAAGAVLVGKTNMDEFGMGSSTENSAFGTTANPWGGGGRVPGGSSGGSAAAVAARLCAAALGTDTGGSIRQPAAFCGCVGLKPSYGRVSRQGLIAYASSLDVIGALGSAFCSAYQGGLSDITSLAGPMGNSVEDCALLLNAIAGGDIGDATASTAATEDYAADLLPASSLQSAPLKGVRLGLVRETASAGLQPGVAEALRTFAAHVQSLGAEIVEVSLPSFALGLPAYYVIAPAEASSNLARYDGLRYGPQEVRGTAGETMAATRGALFGDEVKRRILMGTYALSAGYQDAYYTRAQRVRTLIRNEMGAALASCDALLTPAAPTTAYALGAKTADPLAMYAGDMTTVNVNLAGLPALALPWGLAPPPEGAADATPALPVGVQLIGRDFGERQLLRIAHACEVTAPPLGAPPGFAGPAV